MPLYKKTTSLFIAVFICMCVVFPIFRANNFFKQKGDTVQKDRTEPEGGEENQKPEEMETKPKKTSDIGDQKIAANSISLPKIIAIEKPKQEFSNAKIQPQHEEVKKEPSSQEILAANGIEREGVIAHQPLKSINVQSEAAEHKENITRTNESLPVSNLHTSFNALRQEGFRLSQEKRERLNDNAVKPVEKFNFESYSKRLVEMAGLEEGDRIPLLVLDEQLYKEGLSFYGYKLVARPKPLPKEPYYFIINKSEIKLVCGKCPYIGTFPPATQQDNLLFQNLLSQSVYSEMAKDIQLQLFYCPTDIRMEQIIKSKLKIILNGFQKNLGEVAKIQGKFQRVDNVYILIIESFQKIDGEVINVIDPDGGIAFRG